MHNNAEWGRENEHKEKIERFCVDFIVDTHAFIGVLNAAFF